MSSNSRVKRLLRKIENLRGNQSKKRRISGSDAESSKGGTNVWMPKSLGDFPTANIYNSTSRSPPAELFRKDLISAMKLPDNEPLSPEDYWGIADTWKQEWERGVQVPVNPEALPISSVRIIKKKDKLADFRLPKKLVRITHDEFFSNEIHQMINAPAQAEKVCRYDLDDCDMQWLIAINEQRHGFGLSPIKETLMENVMEDLETQCFENMHESILTEAGLGIEYDEDVICDVCRSPDSEEGNEMVFCDSCDICVHQACYGITAIPEGSWLCKTCSLAIKPNCILCPNKGGAMKSTRSGQQWAHVSCALWIPEVSIGCVEKMEPITKIAHIPPSRWALICCLCRDRLGACIQCSVKSCKIAYHVTCGFQNGLDMKALVEDENMQDEVKLRSYCPKHSKNKDSGTSSDSDEEDSTQSVSRKEAIEDKASQRAKRIHQIEAAFYKHVKISDVAENTRASVDVVELIYQYWKLKRRAVFNKPMLIPRSGENDALGQEQEDCLYARMKMFVHLRQDLERVRNLCYMVTRREKLSRSWYRLREQIFQKQLTVLVDPSLQMSEGEIRAVIHACHGGNIYDKLYASNSKCCADSEPQIGLEFLKTEETPLMGGGSGALDLAANGLDKTQRRQRHSGERLPNPYAKTYYFNGVNHRSRRRSGGPPEQSDDAETKNSRDGSKDGVDRSNCHDQEYNTSDASHKPIKMEIEEADPSEVCEFATESGVQSLEGSAEQVTFASVKQETVTVINNLEVPKESSRTVRKIELIEPPAGFNPMKPKGAASKDHLKNGCYPTRLEKRFESGEHQETAKDEASRDTSSKENVEHLAADGGGTPGKLEKKTSSEEKLDNSNHRHRHHKTKQTLKRLKSPAEKTSPKNGGKKTSPTCELAPFRDKLRQESAKIHESLFANSLKGSLLGYRIPKKSRSESESDVKQEDEARPPQQPSQSQQPLPPQPQLSPVMTSPPPPTSPSTHTSPPPPQFPLWKEHKSPPENVVPAPQASHWIPNVASCSNALLPTPPRPPIPLDRRLTRRERGGDLLLPPPLRVNGGEDGFSPRLVIKLRKDPNFPESHRWRRDGDVQEPGGFGFRGELNESPPNIRLKLNPRMDKSRFGHPHCSPGALGPPHPMSDHLHSPNKRGGAGNKYSMRTRAAMDMHSLNSNYS